MRVPDTYTIREKWNARKQPARLVVMVPAAFYALPRQERRAAAREIKASVRVFLDELDRVIR